MRERMAQILKIVCLGLAALLLVQLVKAGFRANPLAGAIIPDVPSLPADTNSPPAVAGKGPSKSGTNASSSATASNAPGAAVDTNAVAHHKAKPADSNAPPVALAELPATNNSSTNLAALTDTNVAPAKVATDTNVAPATMAMDTNGALAKMAMGTNGVVGESGKTNATNSVMVKASGAKRPPNMPPQMMGGAMMGGPGGAKAAKLPPEIQARVDRVTESEILAPVVRPMPMALLGIAGKAAFLRSPSGQTGLVKEGEDLGEIKLLRIGINRVLVEQDGQQKELMIFSGLGGESLISKPTVTSDETTKK